MHQRAERLHNGGSADAGGKCHQILRFSAANQHQSVFSAGHKTRRGQL